jgi:hypothetical protein
MAYKLLALELVMLFTKAMSLYSLCVIYFRNEVPHLFSDASIAEFAIHITFDLR